MQRISSSAGSQRIINARCSQLIETTCGLCGGAVKLDAAADCPETIVHQLAALVACDKCARTAVGEERRTIAKLLLPFFRVWKVKASGELVRSFLALLKNASPEKRAAAVDVETILAGGAR